MAPHGGRIEPATAEVAEAIAGMDYSFYSFNGLKADGNGVLHIESHLFDEPRALRAVEKADIIVTVHGQVDRKEEFVMVGGLDDGLRVDTHGQARGTCLKYKLCLTPYGRVPIHPRPRPWNSALRVIRDTASVGSSRFSNPASLRRANGDRSDEHL